MTIISHPALLPIEKNSRSTEGFLSRSSPGRDRRPMFFICEDILKTIDRKTRRKPRPFKAGV